MLTTNHILYLTYLYIFQIAFQTHIFDYIRRNWSKSSEFIKTKMNYNKAVLTWHFTILGNKHILVLHHSHTSGKKKISIDGRVLLEKKPGIAGLFKKSSFHVFNLHGKVVEVRIRKVEKDSDSTRPESLYSYDLIIDKISFRDCSHTPLELAAGPQEIERIRRKSLTGEENLMNNHNTNPNSDKKKNKEEKQPRVRKERKQAPGEDNPELPKSPQYMFTKK